jgi:hypothetical protein
MKHLLFIIILSALCGCDNSYKDDKPVDLIPQPEMIQVLADIHIADAVAEQKYGQASPNLPLTVALYNRIYQNHHITAAQYKSSYQYYEMHAQQMDNMYTQIITELSKREAVMNKK